MLPIGDDNTGRHLTPFINYLLIGINVLVFVAFQGAGSNEQFTYAFSTVPEEITRGEDIAAGYLQPTPIPVYGTLITSMFMHGGWLHLISNMLYLWIFGDNLENRLGHSRYLVFYLLCGLIASLSHVFATAAWSPENMLIPSLGASGAISGVMGGYLLLFPKQQVKVFMGRGIMQVPAFVALGLWIVLQVISSLGMLGGEGTAGGGGVAYMAHIGGFIAGLLLIKLFDKGPVVKAV
jgi:membrane associated rhomboid family serine protease